MATTTDDAASASEQGSQRAYLFHDPQEARFALSAMDRQGLHPTEVVHAPERVLFGPDHTADEVRAGFKGLAVGVALFVAVTLATVVYLGGAIDAGVLALILYHGALIGAIVGFAYGMEFRHLTHPEDDLVLHGDDVLVRTAGGSSLEARKMRDILVRHGAECVHDGPDGAADGAAPDAAEPGDRRAGA